MNPAIAQAAKKWHGLEKQFPSLSVWPGQSDEDMDKAMASHHANGKHEAMLDLFKHLHEAGHISHTALDTSYIEEGCVEFDHVDVAVCNDSGLDHYVRVYFNGTVEHF